MITIGDMLPTLEALARKIPSGIDTEIRVQVGPGRLLQIAQCRHGYAADESQRRVKPVVVIEFEELATPPEERREEPQETLTICGCDQAMDDMNRRFRELERGLPAGTPPGATTKGGVPYSG